tara:strand:+ start:43 stop:927 length:885 start_codon:yes stop_codon:yes gene_type:complete
MTKKQKLISNVLLLFIILITIYRVVTINQKTEDQTIEYKPNTNIKEFKEKRLSELDERTIVKIKKDEALLKLAIEKVHPNELYVINETELKTLKFNSGQTPKLEQIVNEYVYLIQKKNLQPELQRTNKPKKNHKKNSSEIKRNKQTNDFIEANRYAFDRFENEDDKICVANSLIEILNEDALDYMLIPGYPKMKYNIDYIVSDIIENHYNKLIDLDYSQADIEVLTTTPLILHSSQIEKLKKDFNNIFIKYGNYDLNFDYEYLLRVIPKINMHEAYAFEVCNVMNVPMSAVQER